MSRLDDMKKVLLKTSEPCYYEVHLFDGKIFKYVYREYNCLYKLFFRCTPAIYIYGKDTEYNRYTAITYKQRLAMNLINVYIYLS